MLWNKTMFNTKHYLVDFNKYVVKKAIQVRLLFETKWYLDVLMFLKEFSDTGFP